MKLRKRSITMRDIDINESFREPLSDSSTALEVQKIIQNCFEQLADNSTKLGGPTIPYPEITPDTIPEDLDAAANEWLQQFLTTSFSYRLKVEEPSEPSASPRMHLTFFASPPPLAENEYRCAECGGIFVKGWSDEEAAAEANERLPGLMEANEEDRVMVCDDCYKSIIGNVKT